MRIAVVGSGVSGLVAASLLHPAHEVTVFEADARVGGHVHTHRVAGPDGEWRVDSGFIVFNERNYPELCRILDRLGVASRPSDMSFSVQEEASGLEWNGTGLSSLFAQRRNLLRPSHLRMLAEILRFHREAPALLDGGDEIPLGRWLAERRFSEGFSVRYLVPMCSALWSADPDRIREFPARTTARFFHNHGMLAVEGRPEWRTVVGGSATWIDRLAAPFRDRIRTSCPVRSVRRLPHAVRIAAGDGPPAEFDEVVLAVHADQALGMLEDPSDAEREVLRAIPFQENPAVLHTDASMLPRLPRARASWNAFVPREGRGRATVTYDMNRLQGLRARETYCVSLNREADIDPSRVLARATYHHPLFSTGSAAAQRRRDEVSGVRRTWYCGAWWGWGFHEDGVRSALAVVERLGEAAVNSALYEGAVRHRRATPVAHSFTYAVFYLYADLAELDRLFEGRWFWSVGRWNLVSFRREDYLGDRSIPLDEAVRNLVAERTGRRPAGPVRMLAHPRVLGFVFNPVAFYYCLDAKGERVETIVAEIVNTPWRERHAYVLSPAADEGSGPRHRWRFRKEFHVSPFIDMDSDYDWRFTEPGAGLTVHMENSVPGGRFFDATLHARRRPIAGWPCASVLLRFPLVTVKVLAAIYFEALRLRWKGAPFFAHPSKRAAPA